MLRVNSIFEVQWKCGIFRILLQDEIRKTIGNLQCQLNGKQKNYRKIWKKNFPHCDAMMHVLKDFISLKYSELLTEEISKSN